MQKLNTVPVRSGSISSTDFTIMNIDILQNVFVFIDLSHNSLSSTSFVMQLLVYLVYGYTTVSNKTHGCDEKPHGNNTNVVRCVQKLKN